MSARRFSASQGRPGRGRPHSTVRGRASPQTTTVGQPSGHTDDFNPTTNNPRRFPQSPGNQRARGFPPGRGGRGFRGGTGVPRIFAEGCPAVVDSRLEDIDSLITRFNENTGGQRVDMPLNPGFGTEGQEVNVRSNFFPLNIPQRSTIYDYKMIISPKLPVELRNSFSDRLVRCSELSKYKGCIAHDSSQRLVSSKMLPQPLDMSVRVEDEGRETTFNVKVVFQKPLETSDLHSYMEGNDIERKFDKIQSFISAYDLIVQQHASQTGVRVGSSFHFPREFERYPLDLGLEACLGFFISVRPTYQQLMVNINTRMAAFYVPGNLAEAILAFGGELPLWFVKKLQVVTTYRGSSERSTIFNVTNIPPSQAPMFHNEAKKRQMSVAEFLQKEYGITLKHEALPVVDVGQPRKDGSQRQPVYIPPELCHIPPFLPFYGTLPGNATSEMIKVACRSPFDNATAIVEQGFPILGLKPLPNTSVLPGFDVSISDKMTVVPSRILAPPSISYKGKITSVQDASWNLVGSKFNLGAKMGNWAALLLVDGKASPEERFNGTKDPDLQNLLKSFALKCQNCGMQVSTLQPEIWVTRALPHNPRDNSQTSAVQIIKEAFEDIIRKKKPSFVLVLLPSDSKVIYGGVKLTGDVDLGVHTVCMRIKKARDPKRQAQYFANVALKVNAKLGGINHLVDKSSLEWLTEKKTMLVGIDVTHPGPTSIEGSPSLVAVVASVGDNLVHFPATLGLQRNKQLRKNSEEMVQELTSMIVSRLRLYKGRNNVLPERVIVYRDGVSEGQYQHVLTHEKPLILEAFNNPEFGEPGSYRPSISIIICSKRHHTRTYPTKLEDATPNGNTKSGTVVDKGITDVYNHEFYLQAHYGLQGTVRGTRYTVVYDEHHLDADTLQQGTLAASYLFQRATKAVSLIPVAYYADLACERARYYLNDFLNQGDQTKNLPGSYEQRDQKRQRVYETASAKWGEGVHRDIKDSMFYL